MKELPNKYRDAVDFARACVNADIEPLDMAELCRLKNLAFGCVVREANLSDYDADPARRRFTLKANKLGLLVDWSNPAPYCTRDGAEIRIPAI